MAAKMVCSTLVTACLLSLSAATRAAPGRYAARETPASAEPAIFRIVASDTGFEAPAVVAAGLRHVVFENQGAQIHEAMLVKLAPGMNARNYVDAIRGGALFPKGALDYSGPALLSPGETVELWLEIDPGKYVLICWNSNHATSTAVHEFAAQDDGTADDTPPKADVLLKLVDYRFELAGELRKGTQVLRIETPGPSMHEMDLYRLLPGKTVADLNLWRKHDGVGVPPALAMGGVLDNHDIRRVVWLRRTFSPGHWVFHCEMPMTTDAVAGKPYASHAEAGMVQAFDIAE